MRMHVTAWPRIKGVKHKPGDIVEVADPALAQMLIREGQAREAGTPEPLAGGPAASLRAAQVDAGLAGEPNEGAQTGEGGDPAGDAPPPKPGRGASHADWVAYAVGQGMDTDTAQGMTRAALAAHFAGA
ncbi:hypothetical protein [Actinomadura geliboluensis]|uniref:hypothetical protein n=1 Tax=Actinomadura geliboluensis TaxID=882440 RepID=UPI0036974493